MCEPPALPLTWNHFAWWRAASDWRHFLAQDVPWSGKGTSIPSRRNGREGEVPFPTLLLPWAAWAVPLNSLGLILFIQKTPFLPDRLSSGPCRNRETISVKTLSPLEPVPTRKAFNAYDERLQGSLSPLANYSANRKL